jgi:hypothetical protein
VHLKTFLSIPITQKCQILSCGTLVANERYWDKIREVFSVKFYNYVSILFLCRVNWRR